MFRRETVETITKASRCDADHRGRAGSARAPVCLAAAPTPAASPESALARQPDGHDQVRRILGAAFDHGGPERRDQTQTDLVFRHRLDPFTEKFGVETDLQRDASELHWPRLPRLPDVLRARE